MMRIGEGSDEHFGGYQELLSDFLLEIDPSWPAAPSEEVVAELAEQVKAERVKRAATTPATPLEYKKGLAESTQRMLNNTSMLSLIATVGRLPFAAWTERYTTTFPETAQAESLDGRVRDAIAHRWHPLHTSEYLFTKGFFCNFLLRYLGDNIDMVHHVETRPPFLDHHLTEYANNLPPSLKIKFSMEDGSLTEKYILREAVKPFVTEEIYERPKKPYLGPTKFSENGPLHRLVLRLTSQENVDALGFVDWEKTQEIVKKAFQNQDLWSLRAAFSVCQFVVLSQRFKVARASS
jgi:asparagine synthase (glutamine-hydrolysing)